MSQVPREQRRYIRHALSLPIRLLGPAGQLLAAAQTVDISDGGALVAVEAQAAPGVGTVLGIEVQLPAGASPGRTLACQGTVLRHQDVGQAGKQGVAVQFLQMQKLGLRA